MKDENSSRWDEMDRYNPNIENSHDSKTLSIIIPRLNIFISNSKINY